MLPSACEHAAGHPLGHLASPRCRCRSGRRRCRRAAVERRRPGQPGDAVLGGRVRRRERPRHVRGDRAVVDDPSAARRLRASSAGTRCWVQRKAPVRFVVDDRPPLLERRAPRAARRVHRAPALLKSRSSRPKRCSTSANSAATDSGSRHVGRERRTRRRPASAAAPPAARGAGRPERPRSRRGQRDRGGAADRRCPRR